MTAPGIAPILPPVMNVSQHTGAFVIRFHTGTDPEWFEGRVEHVASGQLAHFYSRDELVEFLGRMLTQARAAEIRSTHLLLANSHPTLQLSKGKRKTKS